VGLGKFYTFLYHKKNPLVSTEELKFCRIQLAIDNKKSAEELGYIPTSIKETLVKAVNWYRNNGYVKNT